MNKIEVETVVRLHTLDAVLEVGTDADTSSCVEIRTPDNRSREYYGDIRLALQPKVAIAMAHAFLRVAAELEPTNDR